MSHSATKHIGYKISSIRRLVGLSQSVLGEKLGITKQAVSKLEQSEKIGDKRIKEVANALGVTEEGLKNLAMKASFIIQLISTKTVELIESI